MELSYLEQKEETIFQYAAQKKKFEFKALIVYTYCRSDLQASDFIYFN